MIAAPDGMAGRVAGSSTFGPCPLAPEVWGAVEKIMGSCLDPGGVSKGCWAFAVVTIAMKKPIAAPRAIAGFTSASPRGVTPPPAIAFRDGQPSSASACD